jgi:hypothetical protein
LSTSGSRECFSGSISAVVMVVLLDLQADKGGEV